MDHIKIGDTVTLQSPFDSERQYIVMAISGAYVTLGYVGLHKDLVIYIKCINRK